jgi:hypothetical protein
MERNYDAYRPDVAESLIIANNTIEKLEFELERLRKEYNTEKEPHARKNLDDVIRYDEAELSRAYQDREDILNNYEPPEE